MAVCAVRLWLGMEELALCFRKQAFMAQPANRDAILRNVSILCVDADRVVLNSLEKTLRCAGHSVTVAQNAADAVVLMKAFHYDLLLLDCVPAFAWLTQEAKRTQRDLRIAICTSDPRCSPLTSIDAVWHRPFPAQLLLKRIERLLLSGAG